MIGISRGLGATNKVSKNLPNPPLPLVNDPVLGARLPYALMSRKL